MMRDEIHSSVVRAFARGAMGRWVYSSSRSSQCSTTCATKVLNASLNKAFPSLQKGERDVAPW